MRGFPPFPVVVAADGRNPTIFIARRASSVFIKFSQINPVR
jgi:hypothetical protein